MDSRWVELMRMIHLRGFVQYVLQRPKEDWKYHHRLSESSSIGGSSIPIAAENAFTTAPPTPEPASAFAESGLTKYCTAVLSTNYRTLNTTHQEHGE